MFTCSVSMGFVANHHTCKLRTISAERGPLCGTCRTTCQGRSGYARHWSRSSRLRNPGIQGATMGRPGHKNDPDVLCEFTYPDQKQISMFGQIPGMFEGSFRTRPPAEAVLHEKPLCFARLHCHQASKVVATTVVEQRKKCSGNWLLHEQLDNTKDLFRS